MLIACTSILSLFSSHLCFDQFIFTLCSLPYVHFHNSIYSSFSISLWFPENFGLFSCFSQLYVHFLLPDSVFLSGFRRILDFFPVFLGFMSIFSCLVPYFLLASGEFWTFLRFFCSLCPFSPALFRISLWLPDVFGLFYAFSRLYVHFLLPGSVFPSGFRMILDFFLLFLSFISIWKSIEVSGRRRARKSQDGDEFGSLQTAMRSEVSKLRRVQKSPNCDEFRSSPTCVEFRSLRIEKSCTESDKKASYHLSGKRNS